ncbi:Peroxidase 1 [Dendrobium catenatum]|uniref:Peroxidase n=1 Tax=Dendrobium catenatum TaxID=906689 RepID=A0A2I0X3S4_9ASPA|nr:Peroxidase 1 [Dendrobium catenatum]
MDGELHPVVVVASDPTTKAKRRAPCRRFIGVIAYDLQMNGKVVPSFNAQVMFGFYNFVCPNAEAIVNEEMKHIMAVAPSLAGPLLQKVAPPNLSIRGFEVIDRIKEKLEAACPGIVSCADIIALVARDAVALTHGPCYQVETGRRDGTRSVAQDVIGNLVPPTSNITALKAVFLQKGLTLKDLVVLSGAHTIGTSHCSSFSSRLYNATGKGDTDPTLDKNYVPRLKSKCKPNDQKTLVEMDPGSFKTFDVGYFKQVSKRRSLFLSDEALLHDSETRSYVERQAMASPDEFFRDFAASMVKMGRLERLKENKAKFSLLAVGLVASGGLGPVVERALRRQLQLLCN